MEGFFDPKDGSPKISLEISGTNSSKKIIALFDTGHNESLSLPIIDLIEIGATLSSYGEVVYASGNIGVVYYFSISVIIDGKKKSLEAGMIENPSVRESIAGLQLFSPYVSIIDFKNKTMGFIESVQLAKMFSDSKTSSEEGKK